MKSSKLIIGLFVVVVCYQAPLFAQGMSDAEKQEMERRDAFRAVVRREQDQETVAASHLNEGRMVVDVARSVDRYT